MLLPSHLPPEITSGNQEPAASRKGLWDSERAMIVSALQQNDWNKSKAARALGISRDNLRYRVKEYNIRRGETRPG